MCAKVGLCCRVIARIKRAVLVDSVRRLTYFPINDDLFGLSDEQKQEFWKKCGSLGALGMAVPAEYGGSPAGSIEMVLFQEEIARASAAIALSLGAHSGICMMPIAKYGTEEQKRKYLPKLCSGEHIGALALSEHHAGSDVIAMRTHATRKGDHYVLNGSKFWITNGPIADILVVYVKTDPSSEKPFRSISAFIIERGMKGFRTSPKLDKLGMRGSDTGELIFENCEVPVENLLGEPGQGVYTLMSGLDVERGMGASLCLGIMQACCDVAFKYAHEREAFGQKIGHFQMIQSKLADMYTRLVTARSLIYNISRAIDSHTVETQDCAAGILYAAESATRSALDTIQILGGNGYVNDYPAGRLLRDAKLMEIGAGTSEIRRLVIGRSINATYRN